MQAFPRKEKVITSMNIQNSLLLKNLPTQKKPKKFCDSA